MYKDSKATVRRYLVCEQGRQSIRNTNQLRWDGQRHDFNHVLGRMKRLNILTSYFDFSDRHCLWDLWDKWDWVPITGSDRTERWRANREAF